MKPLLNVKRRFLKNFKPSDMKIEKVKTSQGVASWKTTYFTLLDHLYRTDRELIDRLTLQGGRYAVQDYVEALTDLFEKKYEEVEYYDADFIGTVMDFCHKYRDTDVNDLKVLMEVEGVREYMSKERAKELALTIAVVYDEDLFKGEPLVATFDRIFQIAEDYLEIFPPGFDWEKHREDEGGDDFDEEIINFFKKRRRW